MKPTDENVRMLSKAVLTDVKGDADQTLAEAKARAEVIHREAEVQAEEERKRILAQAAISAELVRSQAIATTQLKARTRQLEEREKQLDAIFDAALQRLSSLQQNKDYEGTVSQLLREAVTQLGAEKIRVRADKVTKKHLTESLLGKVSKETGRQVELGEPLETGMGIICETEDGHRQYDNTLETRLKRMQASLRSPVYHILMGEAV